LREVLTAIKTQARIVINFAIRERYEN